MPSKPTARTTRKTPLKSTRKAAPKTTRKTTRKEPKPNARVVELAFSVAVPLGVNDRLVKEAVEEALNEVSSNHWSWAVGFTKVTASRKDFVEDIA